jgi:cardiolipin synthase A/B
MMGAHMLFAEFARSGNLRFVRHSQDTSFSGIRSRPRPLAATSMSFAADAKIVEPEAVELLDGGKDAYPRMLEAIANATQSIHLEVYAFALSKTGGQFTSALADAARRGVSVHVVMDGWGSVSGGRTIAARLRLAGCNVRIYNRALALLIGQFARNHRKILLVDNRVAFLGGINIGDENVGDAAHAGWADLALEIHGPQCEALGHMVRHQPYPPVVSALRIYLGGLGGGRRLRRRYLHAFAVAKNHICVAHGYFLPDRSVVRALKKAARRGVRVDLVLAGRSDVPFARAASRSLYRELLRSGVHIYEWNESVLHAKVATVDGVRMLVGSFNLDPLSIANLEALVEVTDVTLARKGEAWIDARKAGAQPITEALASSVFQRWIGDPIGRIVVRFAEVLAQLLARG